MKACAHCGSQHFVEKKLVKLKGHSWWIWDDGYRWWVKPAADNPNANMHEPVCVFEYKHNDHPPGLFDLMFKSLPDEDTKS